MPAADPKVSALRAQLTAEALQRWQSWIDQIVAGGDAPETRDIFEVGAILNVPQPLDALESDVKVVREVHQLEAMAEAGRLHIEESLRPYGGDRGVQERIEELKAELRKLEQLASPWRHIANTGSAGRVNKLRRENPRAFPPALVKSKSKPAARGRKPQEIPS